MSTTTPYVRNFPGGLERSSVVNSQGKGFFISNGRINAFGGEAAGIPTTTAIVSAPNQVIAIQFTLPCSFSIGRVSFEAVVTTQPASHFAVAIYDEDGNLICQSGQFDGSSATVQTSTFPNVILPFGTYYFAQSADNAGIQVKSFLLNLVRQLLGSTSASPYIRMGFSPNAYAGGFPQSLGVLDGVSFGAIPVCLWEFN